jgi:multidrug efflux system outer membrane protein
MTDMRRFLFSPIIAILLAGCMTGPDYHRPNIDVPQTFRFEDKEARALVNAAWWEQFQDPALNDLVRTALAQNKDVKIAAARIEEFLGRLGVTRAQLFPQLGAAGGATRQRTTRAGGPSPLPGGIDPVFNTYDATLNMSWEIDIWGRLRRATEAARADLLATEEARRATILTLVASVATAYINLRDLDLQLGITRRTVAGRTESLKLFDLRFRGGVISEMELSQARSEFEAAAATIPQFEKQIAQLENALSVLLGKNPGPIARGRALDQLALPEVPAGLPSALLERRPDIRQAEQNLIAANARIGAAKALYFPTITLTGLLGSSSAALSSLFTGPARVWSYSGGAKLPIFTAGGIAGQVLQAEAQQQQVLLQYQQAIQNAFREVEDALIDNLKSREELAAQLRQAEALRTYARLARLRYENGSTSYLDVLDAERSLFSIELAYTQAQGRAMLAIVNLYKAMGGGWIVQAEKLTGDETGVASK